MSRWSPTAARSVLAVLWLGMSGFVLFHSYLLLRSHDDPVVTSFRTAWFLGLGLFALLVYLGVRDGSTADEAQ